MTGLPPAGQLEGLGAVVAAVFVLFVIQHRLTVRWKRRTTAKVIEFPSNCRVVSLDERRAR